jgi:hypothetical protein
MTFMIRASLNDSPREYIIYSIYSFSIYNFRISRKHAKIVMVKDYPDASTLMQVLGY